MPITSFQNTFVEPQLIGESAALLAIRSTVELIAPSDAKVLITGESGVGKDVVSRYLHARSTRRDRPFVAVNCAALNEGLLESELFGHVRGSFTGAYRDKIGKLQLADTGTIFLDEIGEMALRMQALLLRFLENGEIQPVGSDRPVRRVQVRVVAATNRALDELIAAGRFREDLMYRLNVINLYVPPLRERREDIRPLVNHIVDRLGRRVSIAEPALRALEAYKWPGNVRELQNVVEQAALMANGPTIEVENLPPAVRLPARGASAPNVERRRRVADQFYDGLVSGTHTFWEHVYSLFLQRDLTREDLRYLVKKGLVATGGNYRALVTLFGMPDSDYKRFLNALASHDCAIDFRPFRTGRAPQPERFEVPRVLDGAAQACAV
jgi:transcriptional regulator with PAS, ATPase and Fis domain